ncbi:MAG: type I pullulanase [Candidatus Sumerlaeia bacterium]|nr:type I pullulanase [Candidatus Sumerlaeia bacterium]
MGLRRRLRHSTRYPLAALAFGATLAASGCATLRGGEGSSGVPDGKVRVHYFRYDGQQDAATLWTWDLRGGKAPEPGEVEPTGTDDFGVYFDLDLSAYGPDDGPGERIGFLPRLNKDWNLRDGSDREWNTRMPRSIWLIGNDPKLYTERPETSPVVFSANVDSPRELTLKLSHPVAAYLISPERVTVREAGGRRVPVASVTPTDEGASHTSFLKVATSQDLDLDGDAYTVSLEGYRSTETTLRNVMFDASLFGTDEPMGALYTPEATTFRFFSPQAVDADVVLYDDRDMTRGRRVVQMANLGRGVWEATVRGDLEGKHYRLSVETTRYGRREFIDPMATNTTGDGSAARITDLRATDPPGFRPIQRPDFGSSPVDAVIYQLHVRDFTVSPTSGVPEEIAGKYTGFVHPGATLPGNPLIKTGLDHLVELGVTHVQFMPFQDFDNDEDNPDYSWGYMTSFFESPDGWFATEFRDETKLRETKEMIHGLKERNIGAILDVVYNHTGTQATFELGAPGYYLRMRDDGSFWNGSGTGNEFRSESPMARRYLIDSCKYWVEEFGIDGFRFDLMGLIDLETMTQLKEELEAIYPGIIIYGEPWAAGPSGIEQIVDKNVVRGTGLAAFNDHIRDAIKGSTNGDDPAYIQTGARRDDVVLGIAGAIDDWSASPEESINYCAIHDNLDLWDKLEVSAPGTSEEERMRMVKLAGAILGTSQGIMVLHGGMDFCRYKFQDHNSYASGDRINKIDWTRKETYLPVNEFFRSVIDIRRSHPMFRLRTADDVRKRLRFHHENLPEPTAIVYSLDGSDLPGETWRRAAVFLNPSTKDVTFKIPFAGEADAFIHDGKASAGEPLATVTGTVTVPARSATLLAQR